MKFWFPWTIDSVIAAATVYFFFAGLADGSVTSFNIAYWAAILPAVTGITFGSLWLKRKEKEHAATVLLWALALPGLVAVLFMLFAIILRPRWN